MMKKTIIFGSCFAVFLMLMIPNVNAVESNTVLNLKKSFSNKSPELIKEQINDKLFSKLNNSILFILLSILLDVIAYRLITQNYIAIGSLILLFNLFIIVRFS